MEGGGGTIQELGIGFWVSGLGFRVQGDPQTQRLARVSKEQEDSKP